MGKGSKRRPLQIPQSEFDKNFEKIFGKKDKKYDPSMVIVDDICDANIEFIVVEEKQSNK